MKRLLKVFAFLGGLGAIGWLIRNRFVGMTLNREPETPEPIPEPAVEAPPEDDVNGSTRSGRPTPGTPEMQESDD